MICAIVPAAGVGRRMGADIPKQFLQIGGKTILAHSLERLAASRHVACIVVSMSLDCAQWHYPSTVSGKPVSYVAGGERRMDSVLCALNWLTANPQQTDWVLVHDAARPNLKLEDIDRLVASCLHDPVGGLLALPVQDTMKLSGKDGRVANTADRKSLWHAMTPQMFRVPALRDALICAGREGATVTDDASAMELTGAAPLLIRGSGSNFKVTNQDDFELMTWLITQGDHSAMATANATEV